MKPPLEDTDKFKAKVNKYVESILNQELDVIQRFFDEELIGKYKEYMPHIIKKLHKHKDNSNAFNFMGITYYNDCYFNPDIVYAIECFRKAAAMNNTWAMINLGNKYVEDNALLKEHGINVKQVDGINLYQEAMMLNSYPATYYMAMCLYKGDYIDQDLPTAIKLFKKVLNPIDNKLVSQDKYPTMSSYIEDKESKTYDFLSRIYKELGDYEEMSRCVITSHKLSPYNDFEFMIYYEDAHEDYKQEFEQIHQELMKPYDIVDDSEDDT